MGRDPEPAGTGHGAGPAHPGPVEGEDELVVEAEAEEPAGPDGDPAGDAPAGWRAPVPAELPENPLLPPRRDLSLDRSVVAEEPPGPPEFARMRLQEQRRGVGAGPPAEPGAPARATAYDRRRPHGRTRWHEIFEPTDDDLRRRFKRKEAYGAAEGAGLFSLLALGLTSLGFQAIALVALPGAVAGFVAVRFGQDSAQGWSLACLLAAGAFAAVGTGPFLAVLMGAAGGSGWLVGMTREWRATVDS